MATTWKPPSVILVFFIIFLFSSSIFLSLPLSHHKPLWGFLSFSHSPHPTPPHHLSGFSHLLIPFQISLGNNNLFRRSVQRFLFFFFFNGLELCGFVCFVCRIKRRPPLDLGSICSNLFFLFFLFLVFLSSWFLHSPANPIFLDSPEFFFSSTFF